TRALEPLHLERLTADGLLERLADRQAEQRQAFLVTRARLAVELQAMGRPILLEAAAGRLITDVMLGLLKPQAVGHGSRRAWLRVPIDTLLLQDFLAEQAQQHIIGCRVLAVQLEALALEVLHDAALFGQLVT